MDRGDKAMVVLLAFMLTLGIALIGFGLWADGRHAR